MLIPAVIVFLASLAVSAWPAWPHNRRWGYYPAIGIGIIALTMILLVLSNVI